MSLSRIGLYISFFLLIATLAAENVHGANVALPTERNGEDKHTQAEFRLDHNSQVQSMTEGEFSKSSYFDLTSYSFASLENDRMKDFLETREEGAKEPISKAVQLEAMESLSDANTNLVPEPSSIHLIAMGVVYWACRRRRGF